MATIEHLNNAPITEALLEIRATLPTNVNIDTLEAIQSEIKGEFPTKEVKAQWETSFMLKPGEAPTVTQKTNGPQGYMFYTTDKKKIFQSRLNGFTYNQLSKYESWEKFLTEGMRLWNLYKTKVKPISTTRIGLRFINRIDLPLPVGNILDYINTVPQIVDSSEDKQKNYFMRMELQNNSNQNQAIVSNALQQAPGANTLGIILDIDVFRDIILTDEKKIMEVILSLREYKNNLFFSSITEKTKQILIG